jgi:hypothetical protein
VHHLQVCGEESSDTDANLPFAGIYLKIARQPQVGTEHIDALLALFLPVVS